MVVLYAIIHPAYPNSRPILCVDADRYSAGLCVVSDLGLASTFTKTTTHQQRRVYQIGLPPRLTTPTAKVMELNAYDRDRAV